MPFIKNSGAGCLPVNHTTVNMARAEHYVFRLDAPPQRGIHRIRKIYSSPGRKYNNIFVLFL
ncbi:hypothetical protein SABO8233_05395 [Salmonella bongori]